MPYHIPSNISQQLRREVAPSPDSEYGKEARIQVPILMLYPESYVDDCQFLKDAPLVKNLDTLTGIEGPQKFGVRAYSPRSKYIEVNEAIEENFKESIVSYLKK